MAESDNHWNDGYIAELDYTHGFYGELSPHLLALVALAQGKHAPIADQPLKYCELGCGQGLSINILASANPDIEFHANDFNPGQIAGARRIADAANLTNANFYEDAFQDFADNPSLPGSFDIISLHGIYSWISSDNRQHIVNFIQRKLKPGGLVYISYNTLPGWASVMPLRQLLVSHAGMKSGPIGPRIDQALAYAQELSGAGSDYVSQNPAFNERLQKMLPMDRSYLAHEYFNRDWMPSYFEEVATEFAKAKLSFLGSAYLIEHLDAVNFTAEQTALLNRETDLVRRQTLRDYLVNQQFRRDVFVKGAENLTISDSREMWLLKRFALTTRREDISLKFSGRLGEIALQEEVYVPILDSFVDGPATVHDITQNSAVAALGWAKLLQALTLLVGLGHICICHTTKNEKKRRDSTRALNRVLLHRAQASGDITFLASPVTGSGFGVGRFEQMFLQSISNGKKEPAEWANSAWQILSAQGQKLQKEGNIIESDEENLAELTRQATEFAEKKLPVLISLQIA